MAGQIDFGILTTPNYLGDALRYQKAGTQQRDEERLRQARATGDIATIRQIDPDEAAAMEKTQMGAADRAVRVKGATAAASGDWQGARKAYAEAGDIGAVADVDKLHDASKAKLAEGARFLQGIRAERGDQAMIQAFDEVGSNYSSSPEGLAAIREKLLAAPEPTLAALAGATNYQFKQTANGGLVAIDPNTAEAKEIYKGQDKLGIGWRYGEDGRPEYIQDGPADPTYIAKVAGVRRQAVVDRPTKKTGGKASSGGMKLPSGFILD